MLSEMEYGAGFPRGIQAMTTTALTCREQQWRFIAERYLGLAVD